MKESEQKAPEQKPPAAPVPEIKPPRDCADVNRWLREIRAAGEKLSQKKSEEK